MKKFIIPFLALAMLIGVSGSAYAAPPAQQDCRPEFGLDGPDKGRAPDSITHPCSGKVTYPGP